MTRSRYRVCESGHPHFLTCTVVEWLPVFSHPEAAEIVLDSLRFLQDQRRMTIFGYVLLENHAHMIASAGDLAKEIGDFKSFTARQIIDWMEVSRLDGVLRLLRQFKAAHKSDRTYQLWQEGSHPELVQGDDMMRQKLEYIHYNPVKRGYVDDPAHWRYSSARNYAAQRGLIDVMTDW
jgi:putative transposase